MDALNPNQHRSEVIVKLPLNVLTTNGQEIEDKLFIYFQSKQGGDCDVECVLLLWEDADCSWFKVTFVEQYGASIVLARSDHVLDIDGYTIPLEVQGYQAPPGTSVSSSSEVPQDSVDLQSFVCFSEASPTRLLGSPPSDADAVSTESANGVTGDGPNQTFDNQLNERGSHDFFLGGKQGDQLSGFYPGSFSPDQLYMLPQRLPSTQASRLPGNYFSPNATHQSPMGEKKQTVTQEGTSGGVLGNATHRSVSVVSNTVSGLNIVTKEGMTIKLTKGNIAVEKVDVIVNTTGSDLNMNNGKVSHAISLAAGPTLQQECDTMKKLRGSLASWSCLETGPGLLTCKRIYHCVCEGYKPLQSEQFLKKLVLDLMVHGSRNGMTSMAIPALGTGLLSYPPAVTARCMYEAAFEFSSQHPNGSLKDVHFVVYDKDMNTIKGFEDEIQRLDPLSPCATGGATGGVSGRKNQKLRKKKKSTAAASFENPTNWKKMYRGELTKMVTLTAGTDEYRQVETDFQSSFIGVVNQIVEIQRVQNQDLLAQYRVRKAALETRLKRSNVEKVLYHGTDEQTCNDISRHGFNRSFCGKNGTLYGNGTYFAVQAEYSARFAKPNARGIMHMLMTKVLVGDYIGGIEGMITPPSKPQSPGELYDSVVDNVTTPGIYVIFHDAQAYPEYIIKFQ